MNWFVFRNHTVERFFPAGYRFSGYGDISSVPSDVEGYVWFYQMPVAADPEAVVAEVDDYIGKFRYVMSQADPARMMVALTMPLLPQAVPVESDRRVADAVARYNAALLSEKSDHPQVKIVDFAAFLGRYPADQRLDWRFWFLSQMMPNPRLAGDFLCWWTTTLNAVALLRKKCLVLDLDNTLWGGVVGEDGPAGILIGGDYPGKAFAYFQQALKSLAETGVLLAVCSKNNEADVLEAWEKNPFMILRRDDFSALRINWSDKATNIAALAAELNIGLDSMVFLDDNPTEREWVRQMLPDVTVPDFPTQPYALSAFFRELVDRWFRVYEITDEDRRKQAQYRANATRSAARLSFADFNAYLSSLDMALTVMPADRFNLPRIAQMTQKTNQFNLTTRRCTEADIHRFLDDGGKVWCLSVSDRFGDSGITGCLMVSVDRIETFLLSCRILGRGIETAFLKAVLSALRAQGCREIEAEYLPTARNGQVADFYDRCGFDRVTELSDGTRRYKIDLTKADLEVPPLYHIIWK